MNAVEQREHRTVTRALQQQINDLIAVVSALEAQQATIYGETVQAIADEKMVNRNGRDKLRSEIDKVDKCLAAETWDRRAFVHRGFWSRLNWFLTGR